MLRKHQLADGGYHPLPMSPGPGQSTLSLDRALSQGSTTRLPQSIPKTPPRLSKKQSRTILSMSDEGGGPFIQTSGQGFVISPREQPQKKPRQKRSSSTTDSTGTGDANVRNREEVTPWEFQAPISISSQTEKFQVRELQTTIASSPSRISRDSGSTSPNQTQNRPKTSSASLPSVSFASMPPVSSSGFCQTLTISTGPVAEVTPWELHPHQISPSTGGDTRSSEVASPSTSNQSLKLITRPRTNTGPVEEVTPWELALGPGETLASASTPPSPSRRSNNTSFKATHMTSPSNPRFSPLPDIPMDAYSRRVIYPVARQATSISQLSDHSSDQAHGYIQSGFKRSRPGSGGDKERRDSSSNASVAERIRQVSLTGPVEEVAPWEMYPAPEAGVSWNAERTRQTSLTGPVEEVTPWEMHPSPEIDLSSKVGVAERTRQISLTGPVEDVTPWEMQSPPEAQMTTSSGNHVFHSAATSLPPPLTIEMWRSQKSAGRSEQIKSAGIDSYYTHEENQSMRFPGLLFSGLERSQSDSVTATSQTRYISGGRTLASNASLPLHSDRPIPNGHVNQADGDSKRQQSVAVSNFVRERSQTTVSRPGTSSSGHSEKIWATSMFSTMNTAQMEEVLPWELHPVPLQRSITSVSGAPGERDRKMNIAQMEEVLPWELYPIPNPLQRSSTTSLGMMGEEKDRKTSRTSTPSMASKALAELGLKKRRSTGKTTTGGTRVPSASGSSFTVNKDNNPVSSLPVSGGAVSNVTIPFSSASQLFSKGQTPPPVSVVPSSSSGSSAQSRGTRSTIGKEKGPTSSTQTSESSDVNSTKFSTADRTILDANIRAREAQFLVKGVGYTVVGDRRCPGRKYHPYHKNEVPYPRSYDREVVDFDVWETMFWLDLCKDVSWHTFETPPAKVLEIGCGTGTWILQAARTWKECHFVGLDIVPLHPNLQNIRPLDFGSRITWVQHNFLDGLPFQNEEFDFVHIKRIALGVPEDKWDKFLEEVQRVMKPGGALEMIEEDLFFPGKPIDDNDDASANTSSTLTNETQHLCPMPLDEQILETFRLNDNTRTAANSLGKLRIAQNLFDPLNVSDAAPRNPRDHTILEAIWHGMLESRFVNLSPLSLLPTYLEYHFQDVRTHPPLLYSFPPTDSEVKNIPLSSGDRSSVTSPPARSPSITASSLNTFDSNTLTDEGSHPSTKNSGKHRSLYVAMDETRSDALSPSDLAQSPKKLKCHSATLPDRTTSIDIRTLNLHLGLRAKEIITCSEPMWEWVQEFQFKQLKKPRFRSDSIEVALLGSTRTRGFNGRNSDNFIREAILEMTRDDFDQILTDFQLDMQDKANIGGALEERFSWRTFTSAPLQDRKAFDSACQRYDEWLANETRSQLSRIDHGYPTVSPIAEEAEFSADAASQNMAHSTSTHLHPPRQLLSCQQLSRAMRVFVTWKESA